MPLPRSPWPAPADDEPVASAMRAKQRRLSAVNERDQRAGCWCDVDGVHLFNSDDDLGDFNL
jgi:hypothetical protein